MLGDLVNKVDVLEGTFSGRITSGQMVPDPEREGYFMIYAVSDTGRWVSTKASGAFDGVKAGGAWSLQLEYPYEPPAGNLLTWGGKYTSGPQPMPFKPIIKPGKPFKPWKPVFGPFKPITKPGQPIKSWWPIAP
jgi:hypothetical protein